MNKTWYIVVILIIIAAAAYWYFSAKPAPTTNIESTAIEQTQIPPLGNGNTTADISADLSQVPDTSAALDQAAAASAQAVSGF